MTETFEHSDDDLLFKLVFENSLDGILLAELRTKKFFIGNKVIQQMLGYSAEEIVQLGVGDIHPPRDLPWIEEIFEKQSRGEIGMADNLPVLRKDGSVFFAEISSTHIHYKGVDCLVGYFRDVTDKKKTHDALIASEERYRALFNHSADAIFVHPFLEEGFGNFMEVNDVACNRLGYTREELLSRSAADISATRDVKNRGNRTYRQDFIRRKNNVFEATHVTKKGTRIPVEISSTVFDFKGKPAILSVARDISDRKRAEKIVRKSEARYQILYNNTPVMMHSLDRNGRLAAVNDHWLEVMGYTSAEVLERDATDFMTDESRRYALDVALPRFFKEGFVKNIPYQMITKEGEIIDVLLTAVLERDESGEALLSLAFMVDVTEMKRAEKALRESEELYRTLVETSPTAISLCDLEGNILFVNEHLAKLHGYSNSSDLMVSCSNLSDLVIPQTREKLDDAFQRIKEKGSFPLSEFNLLRKNGQSFIATVTASLIRDQEGNPWGFLAVGIDTTEKKQAEVKLAETEALLTAVIEQSPIPIVVAKTDGTIHIFNKACMDFLGVTREQGILPGLNLFNFSKSWQDFDQDDNLVPLAELPLARALRGIATKQKEMSVIRSDGSRRYEVVEGVPIYDKKGTLIAGCIIFPDITDRKIAEQLIQKSLIEKEVMLKELHHRVKNNLNIITSLLNLQASRIENKEQAIYAFQESRNRIYAMALVHEKLYGTEDFSQIDMNNYVKTLASGLVKASSSLVPIDLKVDIRNIQIDVNRAIPCGLIINELITNAIKHAFINSSRGTIFVGFELIERHLYCLTVKDDGRGLPDSFNFDTIESLGLELVQLLTAQINGKLSVTHGEGATFSIVFPK